MKACTTGAFTLLRVRAAGPFVDAHVIVRAPTCVEVTVECEKRKSFLPVRLVEAANREASIRDLILAGRAADVRLVWEVDSFGEVGPARFAFRLGSQGEPCFRP